MGLETGTFINDLVPSNPDGLDLKNQGDNHLRLIKAVAKATFPNATKALYFPTSIAAQVAPVNLVATDAGKLIPVNANAGPLTVNLPLNSTLWDGWECTVVKSDSSANLVTVDGNGSDPINGALTMTLGQQYQSYRLIWCPLISGWIARRADSNVTVDGTLVLTGNVLKRAPITGAVQIADGANAATSVINLTIVIGDGVNVITTGVKGYVPVDFAGNISAWTLVADASGSIQIDVWRDTYANFPPTVADTIAGTEKPTLTAQQKNQDTSLTTWTTAFSNGDVFGFKVDSAAIVKQVTLSMKMTKTS